MLNLYSLTFKFQMLVDDTRPKLELVKTFTVSFKANLTARR